MTPPIAYEVEHYVKNIIIGCSPDEQIDPQEVVFDATAWLACDPMHLVDIPHPHFDYCAITDAIDEACAACGHRILQESLAFDAMGRLFVASAHVQCIEIKVRKTQRYAGTKSIGFRIKLNRLQWAELNARMLQAKA